MCTAALAGPIIGAALSAGASLYSSSKAASTAEDQMAQQERLAAAPKPQEAKAPGQSTLNAGLGVGTNNIGAGNQQSNTLLTGPLGVTDPLSLSGRKLYGRQQQASTGLLGG